MSFISRVPRSLLPGARSSRLKDRQKEERELLVKKAFIEDVLKENSVLSVLLGRGSTLGAVLWNADLLPCQIKEPQMPITTDIVATMAGETEADIHNEKNNDHNNLLDEMSLYMESLNTLDIDDSDISCDFQIDSGALECVACGILGFPFMSVVQLSERASTELLTDLVEDGQEVSELKDTHHCLNLDGSVKSLVSENLSFVPDTSVPQKDLPVPSITECNNRSNTSNKYLRPRIFCLEHAVQIEEILQPKGGANILVICHSDYQKIKAHAAAVAEEIGSPFNYNDVPLDAASEEDLHLIDLAIEDVEECSEDWTSKLGVNLRHCVKVRKNSPAKQVQHALSLGDLFCEKSISSDFSKIKWQSRRSRSKIKINQPAHSNSYQSIEIKTFEAAREKLDGSIFKKEEKLIQYSRRRYKFKPDFSAEASRGQGCPRKLLSEEVSAASHESIGNHNGNNSEVNPDDIENSGNVYSGSVFCPIGMYEGLHEVEVLEATSDVSLNYSPSRVVDSFATATLVVDSIEHIEIETMKELNTMSDPCYTETCNISEMEQNTNATDVNSEKIEILCALRCSSHRRHNDFAADDGMKLQSMEQISENINIPNRICNLDSEGQYKKEADKNVMINGLCHLANSANLDIACSPMENLDAQIEDLAVDNPCINSEVCNHMSSDDEVQQHMQTDNRNNNEELISCNEELIDQPFASTGGGFEGSREVYAAEDCCSGLPVEDNLQHEGGIRSETNEELVSSSVRQMSQPNAVPLEISAVCHKESAALDLYNVGAKEEIISKSVAWNELDQPSTFSVDECAEGPRGDCSKEELGAYKILSQGMQLENQSTTETNVGELALGSSSSLPPERNQLSLVSIAHSIDVTTDKEPQKQAETTDTTKKKPMLSSLTPINQSTPALIKKYSRTRRESYPAEKLWNGNEVCSSKEHREMGHIKSTVDSSSSTGKSKRKRELEQLTENKLDGNGFIRSPCEGLRPRAVKDATDGNAVDVMMMAKEKPATNIVKKPPNVCVPGQDKKIFKGHHRCDIDGCRMSFETKRELSLHRRNRCPHEGCGKRFSSHKYAIIHERVHDDERPLKCPWKGCSMSFKWAWARTEHIRVHTGERPYKCKFEGCGLSFRFVSDISRHRRKTGHYENSST